MGIRQIIHGLLMGAAGWLAPNQLKEKDIEVDQYIDDLIKYPPTTKGIPLLSINKIVASQSELLRLTLRDSGLNDPYNGNDHEAVIAFLKGTSKHHSGEPLDMNFDTLYRQVLLNYAQYIHLLPASEAHHHSDVGGLVRHSLEVALNSLRQSYQQILPAIGHVDEEQYRKPRWQYAAWIVGLLHDAGKILFDMRVYDIDSGVDWNPYLSNIYEWGKNHNVERYRVTWRAEHRHKKHENLSIQIIDWVLTPEAKAFLMDNSDELAIEMNHALTDYHTQDGYLQTCLRKADSASTDKDIKTQWHDLMGKRRYPLEGVIISAMRRLRDSWALNEANGNIWVIGGEVYLTYPRSIQAIISKLQKENTDVPAEVSRVLEILENRNLVKRLEPETSVSYFTPSVQINGLVQPERIVKLAWPSLLYESLPVPNSIPGLLRLNNRGKSIEFTPDGAIVKHDEKDEQTKSVDKKAAVANKPKNEPSTNNDPAQVKATKPITTQPISSNKATSGSSTTTEPSSSIAQNSSSKRKASTKQADNPLAAIIPGLNPKPPAQTGNHGIIFHNQDSKPAPSEKSPTSNQQTLTSAQCSKSENTQDTEKPSTTKSVTSALISSTKPKPVIGDKCPASTKPNKDNQSEGVTETELKKKAQETPPKKIKDRNKQCPEEQTKKCVVVDSLLSRKRNAVASETKPNAVSTNWLNKEPNKGDVCSMFFTELVTSISNKTLLIDNNDDVFLFKGHLIITESCIQKLKFELRNVATAIRATDGLLSDIDRPNIIVHKFAIKDGEPQKAIVLNSHITRCIMMDVKQSSEHIKYPITHLPSPLNKTYASRLKDLTLQPEEVVETNTVVSDEQQGQNSSDKPSDESELQKQASPNAPVVSEQQQNNLSPDDGISVLGKVKPDSNLAVFITWLNECWSPKCPFMRYSSGNICLDFETARREFRGVKWINVRVKDIESVRHESIEIDGKEYWLLKRGVIKKL
ncbi:TraI domain-containing protein [Photobacterium damselae]|uniref:MobH family relaxase n=1 Tax=Photobacterium damselae TaxID=38293 RepID=UPI0015A02A0A|nr:MobH family relaxase [Photobacterium damselae]NVO59003.1 TraI domain-containing protein [Photobacterium damselae subsp. damselae]